MLNRKPDSMIEVAGKIGYMNEFPDFAAKGFDINEYNRRFRENNLIINASASNVSYPKHWGPLSIKTVLNGREFYQTGHTTYAVDQDCYLVLDQGRMYSSWIESGDDVESFTVNITPDFQQEAISSALTSAESQLDNPFDKKNVPFVFTEQLRGQDTMITPLLREMRTLARQDVRVNAETLHELFVTLMQRLVLVQSETTVQIASVNKSRESTRLELYQRLVRSRDFMYSCYDRPIGLSEIAGVACLNQHYFLRQFKNTFGVTPHRFLTLRRLTVASRLFQESDVDVHDVCRMVGFSDVASFSKLFKRHTGMSPGQYRDGIHYSAVKQELAA